MSQPENALMSQPETALMSQPQNSLIAADTAAEIATGSKTAADTRAPYVRNIGNSHSAMDPEVSLAAFENLPSPGYSTGENALIPFTQPQNALAHPTKPDTRALDRLLGPKIDNSSDVTRMRRDASQRDVSQRQRSKLPPAAPTRADSVKRISTERYLSPINAARRDEWGKFFLIFF